MMRSPDEILLTIHLKHQKDKNLTEINTKLEPSPVKLIHSDRAIWGQVQESAAERSQSYGQGT